MVTVAIICAVAGVVLLVLAVAWLSGAIGPGGDGPAGDWRERTADTAAEFRDWLRLGR
ncbi:MAG: hypothetical protein QOE06_2568 [Thermoleophilaceae bacterium]|nr:hypothetical protein [Thermoleophilaceae bacterium]